MASKFLLCCVVVLALVYCHAVPMTKREVPENQQTIVSDANQAIDKIFEDINKGMKQFAADGINFQDVLGNITSKASQIGEQLQTFGKEIGDKVQEAAKKQGITTR